MAYVGSKGTRLGSNLSPENQLPASNLRLGQLLFANINSAEARAAGIPIPYPGFNGSVAQALRPSRSISPLRVLTRQRAIPPITPIK